MYYSTLFGILQEFFEVFDKKFTKIYVKLFYLKIGEKLLTNIGYCGILLLQSQKTVPKLSAHGQGNGKFYYT